MTQVLGVDVGSSSVKSGVVDTKSGRVVDQFATVQLPQRASPERVFSVIGRLVDATEGPFGIAFAGVVELNEIVRANNFGSGWHTAGVASELENIAQGRAWKLLNDADAAAIAENQFGAAAGFRNVVLLTLGTGVGSALIANGQVCRGTELGNLVVDGAPLRDRISMKAFDADGFGWADFGSRVSETLFYIDELLRPDLMVLGGGLGAQFSRFRQYISSTVTVEAASFGNQAGFVGAATFAGSSDLSGM